MKGSITREMFHYIPEIEFDIGYRYFLGNMDNYSAALMAILKSVKAKLPILSSMSISKEYQGLKTIAQTLRRMSENVGAVDLAKASYEVEAAVLNNNTEQMKQLLHAYIAKLAELAKHLEILFKNTGEVKMVGKDKEETSFFNYDFSRTKDSIKRSSGYLDRKII